MTTDIAVRKRCRSCETDYPATTEYFHRRGPAGGLVSCCKPCARSKALAHHAANRERHLEQQAAYRAANRDALYAQIKAIRARDPERKRASDRAWRLANLEAVRAAARARYRANTAPYVARAARWARANPEKAAVHTQAKNLRRRGVPADAATRAYMAILVRDPCCYCGARPVEIDHIVPVSRGGVGEWTNLAPVCRRCNAAKHVRSPLDFLRRGIA
jgi:5-methylcytosine-specific restriction endonuclease McrA